MRAYAGVRRYAGWPSLAPALARGVGPAVAAAAAARPTVRWMNVSGAHQRKMQADFYGGQKPTDYDLDKEQWTKQMQWASMDCVLDPNIEPIRFRSFTGAKRWFGRWLTMRKLMERRPGFILSELEELYRRYKAAAMGTAADAKLLPRLTTHGETKRLRAVTDKRLALSTVGSKWKDISQATLAAKSAFELEVVSFELVNAYMGQMTNEDWVQLTIKVVGKHRSTAAVPMEELVEYPVFEAKLGDGVKVLNNAPFIVVAVLDRDGSRHGRDGQDAATLRKALSRQGNSWFS